MLARLAFVLPSTRFLFHHSHSSLTFSSNPPLLPLRLAVLSSKTQANLPFLRVSLSFLIQTGTLLKSYSIVPSLVIQLEDGGISDVQRGGVKDSGEGEVLWEGVLSGSMGERRG